MYYVLDFDIDFPNPVMITQNRGIGKLVFDTGCRIAEPIPNIELVIGERSQGTLTDNLWTTFSGLVISSRFRDILEKCNVDNIDYYPVQVVNEVSGSVHTKYQMANIIGLLDCLNREESEIKSSPVRADMIRGIEDMVIDESKISGELLFRLKDVPGIILAHEKVKAAVEEAKLTGVVFHEAQGYSWP